MQSQPPYTERPTETGGCRTQRAPLDAIKYVAQEVCIKVRLVLLYFVSLDDEGLRLLVLVGTDVTREEVVREQSHAGRGQVLTLELRAIAVSVGSLQSTINAAQCLWLW